MNTRLSTKTQLLERFEKMEAEMNELRSEVKELRSQLAEKRLASYYDFIRTVTEPDAEDWDWKYTKDSEKDKIVERMSVEDANEERISWYFNKAIRDIMEYRLSDIEDRVSSLEPCPFDGCYS